MLVAMDTQGLVYQSRNTKKDTVLADWVVFPTNIIDGSLVSAGYEVRLELPCTKVLYSYRPRGDDVARELSASERAF